MATKSSPKQLDNIGTPHPVRTAVNYEQRKAIENQSNKAAKKKLITVSIVSVFFITVQVIGGWLAGSIAIFTDAAHLASDLLGFSVSIVALNLSQKAADTKFTYGWSRAEIIGTLVSVASIWVMTIWLLVEAT